MTQSTIVIVKYKYTSKLIRDLCQSKMGYSVPDVPNRDTMPQLTRTSVPTLKKTAKYRPPIIMEKNDEMNRNE